MARDTNPTNAHGLPKPEVGSDWAAAWDEVVETVDANLMLSGPVGDRPSTDNVPDGARFEATDQSIIYRNDANNGWVAVAGVGSQSNPIPEQHVETQVAGSVETKNINNADVNNASFGEVPKAQGDGSLSMGPGAARELGGRYEFASNGAWTFPSSPQAVVANGKVVAGWITDAGEIQVGSYDKSSGDVTVSTLHTFSQADDHDNPTLLVRDDGKIMAYYVRHSSAPIYYRTSSSAGDVSAWDAEQSVSPDSNNNHTYPTPRQRSSDGRIYLFYRGTDHLTYVYSDDNGSSWSAQQDLVTNSQNRTYFKISQFQNGRCDIAVSRTVASGTPGNMEDVYHAYFDGSDLYTSDGSIIGSSALDTGLTQVYDSGASGQYDAWVYDVTTDPTQIVWEAFPEATDQRHYYARYDSGWSVDEVADAGSYPTDAIAGNPDVYYSQGITLDHETAGTLYASSGGQHSSVISKYVTPDQGDSWTVEQLTSSERQNMRPWSPFGHTDETDQVVWMRGKYQTWNEGAWDTTIVGGQQRNPSGGTVKAHRVYLSMSGDQSVSSGTWQNVEFDSAFDPLDISSPPTITIQDAGWYMFVLSVTFTSLSAAGDARIRILRDGNMEAVDYKDPGSGEEVTLNALGVNILRPGQTIKPEVQVDTGSSETIASSVAPHFALFQIA